MGEMSFWPVPAITCAVIATVLFLLGRYLYRGPRKRRTSGGRGVFMLVSGLLVLALVVAVARQGGGFEWDGHSPEWRPFSGRRRAPPPDAS